MRYVFQTRKDSVSRDPFNIHLANAYFCNRKFFLNLGLLMLVMIVEGFWTISRGQKFHLGEPKRTTPERCG